MSQNEHSFYKEAKKSLQGREALTFGNVLKKVRKYTKWFLYAFLTMTTLWGCVNQFRHTTSQYMTQGIEFYSKTDNVLPNLYNGVETSLTYQVIYDETVQHKEEDGSITGNDKKKSLAPLEFYSINPFYGSDNPDINEDVDTSSFMLKNADLKNINGSTYYSPLSYTANYFSALYSLLFYDWTPIYNETNNELNTYNSKFYTPLDPIFLSKETKIILSGSDSVEDVDINKDDFIDNVEFYSSTYKNGKLTDEEINILLKPISEDVGEFNLDSSPSDYYSSTKQSAFIIPVSTLKSDFEFNVIQRLDYKTTISDTEWNDLDDETGENKENQIDILNSQSKFLTNTLSFFVGEQLNNFENITYSNSNGESITTDVSINEFIIKKINDDNVNDSGILVEDIEHYYVNFTPLTDVEQYPDSENITITSGYGYTIIPQEKIKPIYPSNLAFNQLKAQREAYWVDNGTSWEEGTSAGQKERTDHAGWAILEEDEDTGRWNNVMITDKETGEETPLFAPTKSEIYRFEKEDVLYYDDTNNFKYSVGVSDYNKPTFSIGTDNEVKYEEEYEDEFIGLVNQNEILDPSNSSSITNGSLSNGYEWKEDGEGDWYIKEDSKFNDVVTYSGQNKNNSSREIFTSSTSDWGDSWDPDYGPMYGLFVWPLAQFSLWVQSWFDGVNYSDDGIKAWTVILGIFLITFTLRGLGMLMSLGSQKNQYKMQEVQTQVAQIKSKYEKYDKSNKQMKSKQQQEIMALYRKNDVNPFASIGTIFITMPIFLSIWTIISSLPAYKITAIGGFSFGVSSFYGMFNSGGLFFTYMFVGIAVGMSQGISSKLPVWLANKRNNVKRVDEATKASLKKQNRTQNILIGVFIFMGLIVQVLLAIYWVFSALFSILTELSRHFYKEYKSNRVSG